MSNEPQGFGHDESSCIVVRVNEKGLWPLSHLGRIIGENVSSCGAVGLRCSFGPHRDFGVVIGLGVADTQNKEETEGENEASGGHGLLYRHRRKCSRVRTETREVLV